MRTDFVFSLARAGLTALCASSAVHAEEVGDLYGGIAFSQSVASDESARNLGTYRPTTVGLGLSVIARRYLALDAYVFNGVRDSSNAISPNTSIRVDVKDGYGFNLHPYLPLSQSWVIYAKLGRQYGAVSSKVVVSGNTASTSNTTYAHTIYGAGVTYNIDARWGLSIDYAKARRIESEASSNALTTVGLSYKF